MAQATQEKISKAVEVMLDEVERKQLRPMQKNGYLCSAKCFDTASFTSQQLQQCVERCQHPLAQAQQVLGNEMNMLQDRLQRCSMSCQDQIRDQMPVGGNVNDKQMAQLQQKMDSCVAKCGDSLLTTLPSLEKRLKESLKQLT